MRRKEGKRTRLIRRKGDKFYMVDKVDKGEGGEVLQG